MQTEQYLHYGVAEEEEREKGIQSVFEEVIAENFLNLGKEIVSQAMEVHRSPKGCKRDNIKTYNN